MKHYLMPAVLLGAFHLNAQELPQASPSAELEQVIGLTKVEVEYSRPSAKGRVIFGDLVPYDAVWRTGANKATKFTTSSEITVEGKKLPAGSYALFTIPHKDSWEVIFNKNTELWGEGDRKAEEDVLTVKVKAGTTEFTENFTIEFANVIGDDAVLELFWEKSKARVNITANSMDQAMLNIKEALSKPDADFHTYHNASNFYVTRNINPKEALAYAEKSVELDAKYYNTHNLALAQKANGRTEDAIKTAKKSLELAKAADSAGYIKKNEALIAELTGGKIVAPKVMAPSK